MLKIAPCPTNLVAAVYEIHRVSFNYAASDFLSRNNFSQLASALKTKLLCAFEKDMPVGYILFRQFLDEAELLSIAVLPDKRRKGTGTALMAELEAAVRTSNCKIIYLEVNEANNAAIEIYRAMGFENIGARKAYYRGKNGKLQNAILMKKRLC